ncbi:hypothetical protein P3W66_07945 [Achromobacter denitrificans]|uniref:hypothetical protein n=1 Tax=Achromobacter denitrificans TaxID=32002 RepID=UPI0012FC047A|nr:hypothetical protein [Achromobacter denitrificans]MDF3939957.1 hypothetical protein [Achromobacter denitrificans]
MERCHASSPVCPDPRGLRHRHHRTPWIAALVTLAALGLTVLSGRLDRRAVAMRPAQA